MLPRGWFADVAPVRDAVLSALASAFQSTFALISAVKSAARLSTASGIFLDLYGADFFGQTLYRRPNESDDSFRTREMQELLRSRGTRNAVVTVLEELTGRTPQIIEPARPADTGGYNVGGVGFCVAGSWGSLCITHASFVSAYRPRGQGITEIAGYGTGGFLEYASTSFVTSVVSDADIYAAVTSVVPLGHTAWTRIAN